MGEEKISLPIIWTKRASKQFDDVLDYWIERNKSNVYALKLIDEVDDRLKFISLHPLASIATNYPNTRKCVMGNYSIIYKVSEDKIYITAFWDNRQDPDKLDSILKND